MLCICPGESGTISLIATKKKKKKRSKKTGQGTDA